ncbi:MAG: hypothetical protein AAFQ19_15345 [Pseudomonadota bacterium]
MYVSVTGLRLKSGWYMPLFWRYAVPSMIDAQNAAGNVMAAQCTRDGVHHTLSVWNSRADMLAYLRSARHARAMRRFRHIATGRVHGFEAQAVPDWDTALALYHAHGRAVY